VEAVDPLGAKDGANIGGALSDLVLTAAHLPDGEARAQSSGYRV